jgi:hypothetical protein
MKKNLLSFILLIGFIVACNQTELAIQYGVENTLLSPIHAIKSGVNLITGNTYDAIEQASDKMPEEEKLQQCESEETDGNLSDIKKVSDLLKTGDCSCKAWGTCDSEKCSCEKLCPWSFALLNHGDIPNLSEYAKVEHNLTFRNSSDAFINNKMDGGYCTGHAALTQRFNRLAFFDEKSKPPYDLNSQDILTQRKAAQYYKKQIEKIASNEPADFPGVKNLMELSNHPVMQEYLAESVANLWASINTRLGNVPTHIDHLVNQLNHSEQKLVFQDIKNRLDNNQQPMVNLMGMDGSYHTLLISHYQMSKDGSIELCANDSNNQPDAGCAFKFMITDEKKIAYTGWNPSTITNMGLHPFEETSTVEQINNLHSFCKSKKGC